MDGWMRANELKTFREAPVDHTNILAKFHLAAPSCGLVRQKKKKQNRGFGARSCEFKSHLGHLFC